MTSFRRALLTRLRASDTRLHFVTEDLRKNNPQLAETHVVAELWACLAERLVYLDADSQNSFGNWDWILTKRGKHLLDSNDDFEPYDTDRYLATLARQLPNLDPIIRAYAQEALVAHANECFLASSVMIGVGSERAFQLLGEAFANWLPTNEAKRFRDVFDKPRQTYIAKFQEFRHRIDPLKDQLPEEFRDNMALTLDSVLNLLRVTRNEAGHPTGRRIDSHEAYINLQLFGRYLKKLYDLRDFFLANPQP